MADAKGSAVATEVKRPFEKMRDEIAGIARLDAASGDSGFDIASRVIDTIAEATSAEEVFAANEAGPLEIKDYIGTPLSVTSIIYMKSDDKYKGGLGTYAVFDAYTDAGEEVKLSTGAPNVVASLRQFQRLGLISVEKPFRFKITEKTTPNGTLFRVGKP